VDVPCTKTRVITRKKIIQSLDRTAVVYVQGQILQSFERDTITFSAEGNGDMSVSGERYNRYELKRSVKGSTTILTLTGVERNHVDLPYEALTTADLQPNGNKLTFSLIVDPKYIPAKDSADQLVIQYKVYSCKNGWGICAVFGRDEQAGETKFSVVKSSNTFIPIDINSKRRYWVEYSIQRRNSPFYNDKFLHMRETSSRTGN
jgi:hypothetical protein